MNSKRSSFKTSEAFRVACKMPPGKSHSLPGEDFRISSSEVVEWLTDQPEILQYLFNKVNLSCAIVFDKQTSTWKGLHS